MSQVSTRHYLLLFPHADMGIFPHTRQHKTLSVLQWVGSIKYPRKQIGYQSISIPIPFVLGPIIEYMGEYYRRLY